MLKIFVDDLREFPSKEHQYNCCRTYKECVLLLSVFKHCDVLNLDFDLSSRCQESGFDILTYCYENKISVDMFIIHSTHQEGIRMMEQYIKDHFPKSKYSYCPMD